MKRSGETGPEAKSADAEAPPSSRRPPRAEPRSAPRSDDGPAAPRSRRPPRPARPAEKPAPTATPASEAARPASSAASSGKLKKRSWTEKPPERTSAPTPTMPVDIQSPEATPRSPASSSSPAPTEPPARPRNRRVTRVVRRIELWSVLKLSIVLFFCLYLAALGALVAIWNVAHGTGQIDRLQSFLGDVGLQDWRFYGDRMFRAAMAIGAIGVLAGSVLAVLVTGLVNVVSEITGGIRFSVIEEPPRRGRR